MHQRWFAEDTDLGDKWRTVAWNAALAFDGFDHRGFFAADVGASTATQINVACGDDARVFELLDLGGQNMQHSRIFVAHIDERFFSLDCPSGDQHALKEQMRGAFEIVAVFECAGFAFVAIYGDIAGASIAAHKAPFGARREARTTEAAQATFFDLGLHVFPVAVGT